MFKNFTIFFLLNEIIFIIFYLIKRNFIPSKYVYLEFLNIYIIFFLFFPLIIIFIYKLKKKFYLFPFFASFLISFLINYSVLMTFIVNGDRSPSMYILTYVYKSGGTTIAETKEKMFSEFFENKKQFKKRVDEQLYLKNIEKKNEKIFITEKGKNIIKIFKKVNLFTKIENF
jgi:hypothetical protein